MAVEVDVRSRTVLVTGGHPLLVPALVGRLLTGGHRVVVPAAPLLPGLTVLPSWPRTGDPAAAAPEVVEHDPEDPDVPASLRHGVDLVLHLTTGPVGDSLATRSTAVLDALFALRVAEVNGARLVVASVDGDGAHTSTVEGLLAGYRSAHDVDAVLARVTDCYGPGLAAGTPGAVSRLLEVAVTTGTVVVDARDHRRHTPCYVEDAVDGLLALAARVGPGPAEGPTTAVHLGPTPGLSTPELAEQVCRATGADVRVVGLAALRDTSWPTLLPGPGTTAPGTRAEPDRSWGWRPRVDLPEGLRRCVAALPALA
ncbi:NAD-dependent epimerase/dehydratase family protein [Aquipuribacter sp. MA13-6]|uniref:NAD-dependent epimerase/dehydratase family protein n=1 Tax=unclassified Aquipuribacter TaxID=2635084 RepID=UPI003EEA0EF9